MKLGARVVIKTLSGIMEKKLKPQPQSLYIKPGESIKPAPKIHSQDCLINWNDDSINIHNFIRGLAPYPCAVSSFKSDTVSYSFKVFESQPEQSNHNYKPGDILSDGKHFLRIACKDGFINIMNLQLEGKTRMSSTEFLRGFRLSGYKIPVS
jgi:methionyl-tRNA formyltransferase